ncbi:MAG: tetratricopeptide repeat protein [Rhizonema sp. PD38]|nr:tetratricopeptide repeat protein [Rhizonema sp. PD38]
MNLPIFKSLRSISLATLVSLLPLYIVEVLPPASGQTSTENPQTATDKLFEQGVQQYRHGQYIQALQTYQRVLEIRRQQNNKVGIAQTLNNIGEVYAVLRESDKALEILQQALVIRRELKDRAGEGETLDNISSAYYWKNQYDLVLKNLQQALAIRREVKDKVGEAKTLSKIGNVYSLGFKQYGKGLELLQQALVIQEQVGDKFQAANTLTRIAAAYSGLDNYPRALESAQKALSLHREVKNRAGEGATLQQIGAIYSLQKKDDLALPLLQQALLLIKEFGIPSQEYQILLSISDAYSSQNKIDSTLEFGQQALVFAQKHELRPQQLQSLLWLAIVYSNRGTSYEQKGAISQAKADYSHVVELSQSALILARVLKDKKSEADALNNLGSAYKDLNEPQKAVDVLQQAVSIARAIKDLDLELYALSFLSSVYVNQGYSNKVIEIDLREVEIAREQKDKSSETLKLLHLASTYDVKGEHQKARETNQQALAASRQVEINKLSPTLQETGLTLEFDALKGISKSENNLGEYDQALDFAQQALKKAQSLKKPELEIDALLNLAFLQDNTFRNFPKAIELSQQALAIAKQIKNPVLEANALQNLSTAYERQRNYSLALEAAEKMLAIAQQRQNPELEHQAFDLLSDIYNRQGKNQKALAITQQNLAVVQTKLPLYEILTLGSLSQSYIAVRDTPKALETAKQALAIAQKRQEPEKQSLSLLYVARVYEVRGEYEQGIEAAQKALEISRQIQSFRKEVAATSVLSEMYDVLGEYSKVIAVAEPKLTLARKINQRDDEALLLINLGNAYRIIGDYPKAKEFIEQGLKIAGEQKNPRLESVALNSLGSYYTSLNDYQKALAVTQQSLKIAQEVKSPPLLISSFFNLGDIYNSLGDYNKSRSYYQQALTTAQQLKNRQSEGIALFAQADTYFRQGEPQKTVELAQQAIMIFHEIKVPRLEAFAHRMLSIGYGELGNDAKAMAEAQTYLTFARKTQNLLWEKSALSLIAGLHQKFGRKEQAIVTYQQALAITTDHQIPGADAYILAGLARIYQLNQPNIAIKYYKDSVNKIEEVRHGIEGLPPELQKSFLDATVDFDKVKVSDIYRQLAELLLSQKRDKEALYVQELLRGQEIRDFNSTGKGTIDKPQIPLTPTETKVPDISQPLVALGSQIRECEGKNTQQCVELKDKEGQLIHQYTEQLKAHDKEIRENRQTDDTFFDPKNLGKIREIVEAQPDTVMIYPLVTEKELIIQLYAQGSVVKTIPVTVRRKELGNAVYEFRQLMEHCEKPGVNCGTAEISQVQAASQKLHNWLIKPIEAELRGSSIKNLVFALDRVIRYVPMSALYDGKQYLIEKYTIYIAPSADLTDTKEKLPTETQNTPVLAMGLSEARPGFSALHNVPKELDAIVRKNTSVPQGIYPGDKYLNNNFDFRTLRDNLKGHKILHLATHGVFDPKSANKSYILLGTGEELTPDSIYQLTGLSDIHLVVLSACQTALASPDRQDGVEINTFASNFLNNKAKSVIASLWQVDDSSTAQLMENFYGNLAHSKTPITKAQALRLAQLSLLYGKQVSLEDIKRGAINPEPIPGKPSQQTSTRVNVSHPYYWAPFILIGNGL